MPEKDVRAETHGCIVCGKLHSLYAVYDDRGRFLDCMVTSADGRQVPDPSRPLVACKKHTDEQVERAVDMFYPGGQKEEEEKEEGEK